MLAVRLGPRLVAETTVEAADEATARNEAFRILAAYIFGDKRGVELRSRLADSRWAATGDPVALFYDPPWTIPLLRRNEVALPVAPRDEGMMQ